MFSSHPHVILHSHANFTQTLVSSHINLTHPHIINPLIYSHTDTLPSPSLANTAEPVFEAEFPQYDGAQANSPGVLTSLNKAPTTQSIMLFGISRKENLASVSPV